MSATVKPHTQILGTFSVVNLVFAWSSEFHNMKADSGEGRGEGVIGCGKALDSHNLHQFSFQHVN